MRYSEAVVVIRSSSLSQYSNQAAPGLRAAVTRRNIPYGRGVVKHLPPPPPLHRGKSRAGEGESFIERDQNTSALRLPPARASSSGGGGGQSRSPPAPSIPLRPARRAAAGLPARRGKSPAPRHPR